MTAVNQEAVASQYGAVFTPALPQDKAGVALSTLSLLPLNALRHPPGGGTSGWYIWGGVATSADPNFFQPLHVEHLATYCPAIIPFLGLAPGWRVLLAPNRQEVWFDDKLLAV
jgi:hypothetical protein